MSSSLGKYSRKTTFGQKFLFNDVTHNEIKKGIPGPGYYPDILGLAKEGKYNVSTFV